jgi:retinol-binding protein 3
MDLEKQLRKDTRERTTNADEPRNPRSAKLSGDSGAHPGKVYKIHPHFGAFIPTGRPISPITGTDWEGTGVIPDIEIPQD